MSRGGKLLAMAASAVALGLYPSAIAGAVGPNLVVDGGFEPPTVPAASATDGFTNIAAPNPVGAWQLTSGDVDTVGPVGTYFMAAAEGTQLLDLTGVFPGRIEQAITTVPGANYELTFMVSGNPYGPPPTVDFVATAGTVSQTFTIDKAGITPTNMQWQTKSILFTAASATTTIAFRGVDGTYNGAVLDAVTVTSTDPDPVVPEVPFALLMPLTMGAMAGAVFLVLRKLQPGLQ